VAQLIQLLFGESAVAHVASRSLPRLFEIHGGRASLPVMAPRLILKAETWSRRQVEEAHDRQWS
jgi:hypothetical protein